MIAMFMAIYATECFPEFREAFNKHFQGKSWQLVTDFKSNVVRIWQKIAEYENLPLIKIIQYWFIDKQVYISASLLIISGLSILLGYIVEVGE